MSLPKSITISGDVWRVSVTRRRPSWCKLDKGDRDKDTLGGSELNNRRLWVRRVDDDVREAATLLHEVGHVLYDYACSRHSGLQFATSERLEESIVEGLETPLRSLIRDNDLSWVR